MSSVRKNKYWAFWLNAMTRNIHDDGNITQEHETFHGFISGFDFLIEWTKSCKEFRAESEMLLRKLYPDRKSQNRYDIEMLPSTLPRLVGEVEKKFAKISYSYNGSRGKITTGDVRWLRNFCSVVPRALREGFLVPKPATRISDPPLDKKGDPIIFA